MNVKSKAYVVERAAPTRGHYDWKRAGEPFSNLEAARGFMKKCIADERCKRPDQNNPNGANDSFNAESAVKVTGLKEILFIGDTLFRINAIKANP